MIYAIGLGTTIKKAFKDKAKSVTLKQVISELPVSPDITKMDALVLCPKDILGLNGKSLKLSLEHRHQDISVIYIYTKSDESKLLDMDDVNSERVDKYKPDIVKEVVNKYLEKDISKRLTEIKSSDNVISKNPISNFFSFKKNSDEEENTIEEEIKETKEEKIPEEESSESDYFEPIIEKDSDYNEEPNLDNSTRKYIDNYMDHNTLLQKLAKDTIVKEAFATSNEIVGLASNLELKDNEIRTIFQDKRLSAEEKIRKISDIGLIRAEYKGQYNKIIVNRINNIIDTCTSNLTELIEEKIDNVTRSLTELYSAKDLMEDTSTLTDMQHKVISTEYELMEAVASLVKTYTAMDDLVADEIKSLNVGLPSENEFINNMVSCNTGLFNPSNTELLANELMKSLQSNRISLSAIEDKVNSVLECLRTLFTSFKDIIEYQDNMIKMLKANRVEDYVICDTVLKSCLRIYVGTEDTGVTSTVMTYSGVTSRRHNTLVIDLTGHNKFRRYGVDPILLENFISNPIKDNLVFVESNKLSTEDLYEMLDKIKVQVHHYPYINIVLDSEDTDNINMLSENALSVTYITNCSEKSINSIKYSNSKLQVFNVARKLVILDTPMNPLQILSMLDMDFTNTKVIPIPNLTEIRKCSLVSKEPYLIPSVVGIFEEAFK